MYMTQGPVGTTATWSWAPRLTAHVIDVVEVLKEFVGQLFSVAGNWLLGAFSFVLLWVAGVLGQSSRWMLSAFYVILVFVHAHIFFVHILAWSIFFGPMIVLIPFLLAHEICILVAFNLVYASHGLLPGSLLDQYEATRNWFLETRESLFSFVDRSSSLFNKWTSEHTLLMMVRLAGGALGTVLLYLIWVGW